MEWRSGSACKINSRHKHLHMDRRRCASRKSQKIRLIYFLLNIRTHTRIFFHSGEKTKLSHYSNCLTFSSKVQKNNPWNMRTKGNLRTLKSLCDGLMLLFTLEQQEHSHSDHRRRHSHSANSDHLLQAPWSQRNVTKPVNCDQFCLCRWRRTRSRSLSAPLYAQLQHAHTHTHTHTHTHYRVYQEVEVHS